MEFATQYLSWLFGLFALFALGYFGIPALIKYFILDFKVKKSIEFPHIDEIEYVPESDSSYNEVEVGDFFITKKNPEENPFKLPREVYRIDSIKRNYFGVDWVKYSVKYYEYAIVDNTYTHCEPINEFKTHTMKIKKVKASNIEDILKNKEKAKKKDLNSSNTALSKENIS